MKAKETISKDLKWDKNPRKITEKKKELLKNHIDELGDLSGVVYCHNNNAFVGGNQRTDIFDNSKIEIVEQYDKPNEKGTIAYGFINYKNERFAYREVNFTEELFKKACIVANNDGGENDWEILNNDDWDSEFLEDLGLEITLFENEVELEAEEDNFNVPEGGIETNIVLGDLIEIGEHRLLCGDSTNSDDVEKLMNGEKADMVFTDPPYGVSFVGIKGTMYQGGKKKGKDSNEQIKGDELRGDEIADIFSGSLSNGYLFTKDNAPFYIFFAINKSEETLKGISDLGLEIRNWLIWDKGNVGFHAMGAQYKPNYESFLYCFKDGNPPEWKGNQQQQTIWRHSVERLGLHPTMKPITLISQAIGNHKANLLLDLFLGSGSTMSASHQLKKKCYGMELDPKYCQVIVDRMIKLDNNLEVKINGVKYISEKN